MLIRKHTFNRKDIEAKEIDQDKMVLEDVLRVLLVQMSAEAVSAGIPIMQYRGAEGKSPAPVMQRFLGLIKWISQASVTAEGAPCSPCNSMHPCTIHGALMQPSAHAR